MATDTTRTEGKAELIVFASTSEEATFVPSLDTDDGRKFNFISTPLPSISTFTSAFDQTQGNYIVTITGSGITDISVDTVDVYFGETGQEPVDQTIVSVTPTELVVALSSVTSGLATNSFEVYFQEGIPTGMLAAPFSTGITFDPALYELSANTGSAEGAIIYATVVGAGINDDLMLVDSAGNDFCSSATMISYSLLECHTVGGAIATPEQLSVKAAGSSTVHSCQNSDVTKC